MASRKEQKEEARARRLAEEQARVAGERRQRRLRMIGGTVLAAVAVIVVAIAISSGGGGGGATGLAQGAQLTQAKSQVQSLLTGIPQSGNQLGSPSAKVTVTEFGDLQCPVCKDFALAAENQLISNDVRSGKVKLVYRSLPTATANGPDPSVFPTQQAAALAAGQQNLGWQYIELFYHQQGSETTSYVNDAYLNGLAKQIPGLNYSKWLSSRSSSSLTAQVTQDEQTAQSKGYSSTPTIVITGPKGTPQPIVGNTDYASLESAIKSAT